MNPMTLAGQILPQTVQTLENPTGMFPGIGKRVLTDHRMACVPAAGANTPGVAYTIFCIRGIH
ncbi:hypothetical protein P4C99_20935 [Pontiellaceae bacterium B1224]|nr:hypothetical protein [Pontiellaceae bacterium B1224]